MSLRTLTLTLSLAAVLPLAAGAETEVLGPIPAGEAAFAYGVSLDILSLGATSVSGECTNQSGTVLATLPPTATATGLITSLTFVVSPPGSGQIVSCTATGTGGNMLIDSQLNVLGPSGDPQVTSEGRCNASAGPCSERPEPLVCTRADPDLDGAIPTLTIWGQLCDTPSVVIGQTDGTFQEVFVLSSGAGFVTVDLTGNADPATYVVQVRCPERSCTIDVSVAPQPDP